MDEKVVYLAESWVARMKGLTEKEIKEKIENGQIKAIKCADGEYLIPDSGVSLTPPEVAKLLFVKEQDVIQWIELGKIKANKDEIGMYAIPYPEYTRYTQSMSKEWAEKLTDHMLEKMASMEPAVSKHVNERFRQGLKPQIEKVKEIVKYLEVLHCKYEKQLDILNEKSDRVAGFIVYARVISLMNSTIKLIESEVFAESVILFRPLFEATLLAGYFLLANEPKKTERVRAWFEKDAILMKKEIMAPLYNSLNLPEDKKSQLHDVGKQLYDEYSKPLHNTYNFIMESYNVLTLSGFGGHKSHCFGFDYSSVSQMRKLVEVFFAFRAIVQSTVQYFVLGFSKFLPLEDQELVQLKEYNDYLSREL